MGEFGESVYNFVDQLRRRESPYDAVPEMASQSTGDSPSPPAADSAHRQGSRIARDAKPAKLQAPSDPPTADVSRSAVEPSLGPEDTSAVSGTAWRESFRMLVLSPAPAAFTPLPVMHVVPVPATSLSESQLPQTSMAEGRQLLEGIRAVQGRKTGAGIVGGVAQGGGWDELR